MYLMRTFSLVLFTCILLTPLSLFGDSWEAKARVAYYYPGSSIVKRIYGNDLVQYQIEGSYRFCCPVDIFANVGFTTKHGHSIGERNATRIRIYPLSLGLKYNFNLPCGFDAYLGAGPTFSFLRIRDHSPFVHQHVRKNTFGAIVKVGICYRFCDCGVAEIFTDYFYTRFRFSGTQNNVVRNDLNMSGFLFGAGIGITF